MSNISYPGDAQFGDLIQAATAADIPQQLGADLQDHDASQGVAHKNSVLGKRVRTEDENVIDTQLRAHPTHVPTTADPNQSPNKVIKLSADPASILYREPSENSTKYSRPVLRTVYNDLQMGPQNYMEFLKAVKIYMLDENHLERRDVIGQKKDTNDTDAAKLRLYGIVQAFMIEDNNGDKFFGPNADNGEDDAPERTFFWPDDSPEVYKHSVPIFRKTITNERQRVYAAATRKLQALEGKKKSTKTPTQASTQPPSAVEIPTEQNGAVSNVTQQSHASNDQQNNSLPGLQAVVLHVNLVSDDANTHHRLKPKLTVSSGTVMTLSGLVAEVNNKCGLNLPLGGFADDDIHAPMIKALLPDGLVRIKDDAQWMVALATASMVDWMDAELKVVIEINPVMAL